MIQQSFAPTILVIALLCLMALAAVFMADRVNKNWRQRFGISAHRMFCWLMKPARVIRLAVILPIALAVIWLTQPPDPDLTLPIRYATHAKFSTDGTKLLIVSPSSWIGSPETPTARQYSIWDVATQTTKSNNIPSGGSWAWSPNGGYLAVLDAYSLTLINAKSGAVLQTVNVERSPPQSWTSRTSLTESEAETVQQLSHFKSEVYPQKIEFVTEELLAVTCKPHESWQIVLRQRGMPTICQRRYRVPDLEDGGTELWTWLLPDQNHSQTHTLIAKEWADGGGWRLLDADLRRTRTWIAESPVRDRIAGLSRDGSVLVTGDLQQGIRGKSRQAGPNFSGVRTYDADIGGLLSEFPDEVNPLFSADGSLLLTQSFSEADNTALTTAKLRHVRNGALITTRDLTDWNQTWGDFSAQQANVKSTGRPNTSPLAKVSESRRLDLHRLMTPGKFEANMGMAQAILRVATTNAVDVPFVGVQVHVWPSAQRSWLAYFRRQNREVELIDIKNNRTFARVPGMDTLGPNLDWAMELREKDVALWKLQGSRWPLSLKQVGLALLLVLGVLLIEMLWGLWYAWLRHIGAVDAKNGDTP